MDALAPFSRHRELTANDYAIKTGLSINKASWRLADLWRAKVLDREMVDGLALYRIREANQ